jgi:hypothetical protein
MFGEQQNQGLMPRALTELFRLLQLAPSGGSSAGTSRLLDFAALESHNSQGATSEAAAAAAAAASGGGVKGGAGSPLPAVRPFRVSMSLVEVGEKGMRDLLAPTWPSGASKWSDSVRAHAPQMKIFFFIRRSKWSELNDVEAEKIVRIKASS